MKAMKTRFSFFILFFTLAQFASAAAWQETYDKLLQKYVSNGNVRYAAWHAEQADLNALGAVVQAISQAVPGKMNRDEKLAFYLNAYNAWIIKTVLDHYPVKSIKDTMFFVFKRDIIKVAGKQTSLSKLENDIIRQQFKDPRIHFALNCASVSCPPLHDHPFKATTLDATLETLTKDFIRNNPQGLKISDNGRKVSASKIFDWYKEDFQGEAGSILAYITKYRGKPFPENAKLEFQEYDWSLNEAR